MEKLTKQEEEAMLSIWQLGRGTIGQILDNMPEPRPPYTTLASTLKNLEKKQYLGFKRYGNVYEYYPLITHEAYKKGFVGNVVQHYFQNSYKEMVTFFAKEQQISAEELREILEMIEQQKP
ncbi:MAG: BlaI/MecI/CopY family transcriptional regulator [Spirosomataceae bacterium]